MDRTRVRSGTKTPLKKAAVTPSPAPNNTGRDNVVHVLTLSGRKPGRKSAQIRWLWPQIRQALAAGHTIYDVKRELALDGIEISYSKLRAYVAWLRRADQQTPAPSSNPVEPGSNAPSRTSRAKSSGNVSGGKVKQPYDPAENLRERLARRPGFTYDDRPPDMKKLI